MTEIKYKTALEEIRQLAQKNACDGIDCDTCLNECNHRQNDVLREIIKKIDEELKMNNNQVEKLIEENKKQADIFENELRELESAYCQLEEQKNKLQEEYDFLKHTYEACAKEYNALSKRYHTLQKELHNVQTDK